MESSRDTSSSYLFSFSLSGLQNFLNAASILVGFASSSLGRVARNLGRVSLNFEKSTTGHASIANNL